MTEDNMKIRTQQPIPGVAYSQYEVSASGNSKEELQKNYKVAEETVMEQLNEQKIIVNKELLAKYLASKDLTADFVSWLKANGKS